MTQEGDTKPLERDAKRLIRGLLKLYLRSPHDPDGWAKCSEPIYSYMETLPDELLEKNPAENKVRITETGRAVVTYGLEE